MLFAAPIMLAGVGCASKALRPLAGVTPPAGAEVSSYTARMMQLAERYEQQGNREGALRLYRQIDKAEPGHKDIEARIAAITDGHQQPDVNQLETVIASHRHDRSPAQEPSGAATPQRNVARQASPRDQGWPQTVSMPQQTSGIERSPAQDSLSADEDPLVGEWADVEDGRQIDRPVAGTSMASETQSWWGAADNAPQESARPTDPVWAASADTDAVIAEAESSREAWAPTPLAHQFPVADGELESILAVLDRDDPEVRKQALIELSALGSRGAVASTVTKLLMNDPDESVRAHAAWATWSIGGGSGQAVTTLASLTHSDRSDVVQVAAFFLGSMGEDAENAASDLRAAEINSEGATRLYLAEALIRIDPQDQDSLNELTEALQSEDPGLRWLAAIALSGVSPEHASEVVPALAAHLDDIDAGVCSAAALTLGSLGPAATSAVGPLEQAMSHEVSDVRIAAETALACIQR
jgi:HEAT repeats